MEKINFDDFKKVEIKIGEIVSAEPVEKSEKLLKLMVNFGPQDIRQVISGVARYYPDPTTLIGQKLAFVTNLEPRVMMGLESQAMLLAACPDRSVGANSEKLLSPLAVDASLPPGTLVT